MASEMITVEAFDGENQLNVGDFPKVSKIDANYRITDDHTVVCANCVFFLKAVSDDDDDRCARVKGRIEADHTSDFFQRIPPKGVRFEMTSLGRILKGEKARNIYLESEPRFAEIFKTKSGRWWLTLGDSERAGPERSTTYGPFKTQDEADEFMSDNFTNPGGFSIDKSGKKRDPKKSPNGRPVVSPDDRRFKGFGGF